MVTRRASHCQDALRWLKDRGWDLAPLTGQDTPVLLAVAHCWQLWTTADQSGQDAALDAVAALLDGCQEVAWPMARELVAQAADWGHRDVVWPKVCWRFEDRLRAAAPPDDAVQIRIDVDRARRMARCHAGLPQVHP